MDQVNVLIVDDSATYRRILSSAIESISGARLIGSSSSGELALNRLSRTSCDLVLVDVEMAPMDGFATLGAIRSQFPMISTVMVSGISKKAADLAVRALQAGAMELVPKPEASSPEDSRKALREALEPLIDAVRRRKALRQPGSRLPTPELQVAASSSRVPSSAPRPGTTRRAAPSRFGLLVIGASTGGPAALMTVVPKLERGLGVPVLLVQHMPPQFTQPLAERLGERSQLEIREAREGDIVRPDTVLIAPGGLHMRVRKDKDDLLIALDDGPRVNGVRPALDVLLTSLGTHAPAPLLAVILTGMGADGTAGLRALGEGRSYAIAQDQQSSVVHGMPKAVIDAGLAHDVLPLVRIPERINELLKAGKIR